VLDFPIVACDEPRFMGLRLCRGHFMSFLADQPDDDHPALAREELRSPSASHPRACRLTKDGPPVLSERIRCSFEDFLQQSKGLDAGMAASYLSCVKSAVHGLVQGGDGRETPLIGSVSEVRALLNSTEELMQQRYQAWELTANRISVIAWWVETPQGLHASARRNLTKGLAPCRRKLFKEFIEAAVEEGDEAPSSAPSEHPGGEASTGGSAANEDGSGDSDGNDSPVNDSGGDTSGSAFATGSPGSAIRDRRNGARESGAASPVPSGISPALKQRFESFLRQKRGVIDSTAKSYCLSVNKAVADALRTARGGARVDTIHNLKDFDRFLQEEQATLDGLLQGAHKSLLAGW
jgi:hypothetical protein